MKRLIIALLLIINLKASAQIFYRRSEFGAGVGSTNYYGDMNTSLGFNGALYSGSVFYKYNFSPYIAMKLNTTYAKISGDDKYSSNVFQQQRNLNFYNDIFEGSFSFDFHFFQYRIQDYEHRFTPYVNIGIGYFYHNPYTYYKDKKYYLRPLGTEGQLYEEYRNRRYSKTAMCFPIGAGIKMWVAKGITLNIEVINRSTTTDYLDDVSTTYVGLNKFQNQNPSPYPEVSAELQDRSTEISTTRMGIEGRQRGTRTTKDQFMTMQIGLSFRVPTYKCPSSNF